MRYLSFAEVVAAALANSLDLKIARADIAIGQAMVDEEQAAFYPTVTFRYYSEYIHEPTQQYSSAGAYDLVDSETGYPYATTDYERLYRNNLVIRLDYNLFDFGARALGLQHARNDLRQAEMSSLDKRIDVKLTILSLYTDGLALCKRIDSAKKVLEQRKAMYLLAKDLYRAGKEDRLKVSEAALDVAENVKEIDELKLALQNVLIEMSSYTGEEYELDRTNFTGFFGFETTGFQSVSSAAYDEFIKGIKKMPDILAMDLAIEAKKLEYDIVRRKRLPSIDFYSSFKMYSGDTENLGNSFGNFREQNSTVGVVASFEIFNGFGTLTKLRRIKAELQQLRLQREKRIIEHRRQLTALLQQALAYATGKRDRENCVTALERRQKLLTSLHDQKIVALFNRLQENVKYLLKALDLEIGKIEARSALIRLRLFAESQQR